MSSANESHGRGARRGGWVLLAWGIAGVIYYLSPASTTGAGAYAAGAHVAFFALIGLCVIGLWQLLRNGGLSLAGMLFVALAAGASYYVNWFHRAPASRHPSRAACEQAVDHVVDLVANEPRLPPRALSVYRRHRSQMIERCLRSSRKERDCVAGAQSFAEFKSCR